MYCNLLQHELTRSIHTTDGKMAALHRGQIRFSEYGKRPAKYVFEFVFKVTYRSAIDVGQTFDKINNSILGFISEGITPKKCYLCVFLRTVQSNSG